MVPRARVSAKQDVLGELLTEYGSKFLAPVSHTTREMRPGEVRRSRRGTRSGGP